MSQERKVIQTNKKEYRINISRNEKGSKFQIFKKGTFKLKKKKKKIKKTAAAQMLSCFWNVFKLGPGLVIYFLLLIFINIFRLQEKRFC